METILLVGDDPEFRSRLETFLTGDEYAVESAGSLDEGMAACGRRSYHLLIAGLNEQDGAALVRWCAANAPETPCVMALGPGGVETLVEALAQGAAACISRAGSTREGLHGAIRAALERSAIARERELLRDAESARAGLDAMVARDLSMLQVLESARTLAALHSPVLIEGEIGTGKETLARFLHASGTRAEHAFVAVDCSAESAASAEKVLFGCENSGPRRMGNVWRAHRGTLYLEEVGRLDGALQGRLARLLETGVYEQSGSGRQVTVDVRVIASTGRDLKQLAAEGRFREDLYRRLGAFSLTIPPLRERRADIPSLARLFLSQAARRFRLPEVILTQGAEKSLQLYDWPGNVRELANVMERAALHCKSRVEPADLPIGTQPLRERPMRWKDIERQAIEDALRVNGGNRTRAARQLGISLRTLQYRLKEWNAAGR